MLRSIEECRTIKKLRNEEGIVITKADKGNAVVIMDREMYNSKVKDLLHADTYKRLRNDPSENVRKQLKSILTLMSNETKEEQISTMAVNLKFSTNFTAPELFCLPKIHKEGIPLRPVVSSYKSLTNNLCTYLARMLKPLIGNRPSHTKNSTSFVNEIKSIGIDNEDMLVSYDVKDLSTSIPLDMAYTIILEALSKDSSLNQRTKLNPFHLVQLVKFCMEEGNFFQWRGKFYSQEKGAPMGSSLSPVIAELFMEHLEEKAFPSGLSEHNVKLFKRYVDDIFAIVKQGKEDELLNHLNNLFPGKIQFTIEREEEGCLPFLDVLVVKEGNQLKTKVYRKATNSEKYLNFLSNHPKSVKKGIVTAMVDRATKICSREYLQEEIDFNRQTLRKNDFPIRLTEYCIEKKLHTWRNRGLRRNATPHTRLVIPYYPGLSDRLQMAIRKLGVEVVFKNHINLRAILRSDKNRLPAEQKQGAVYMIQCSCGARYIGETGHTVDVRFQQHIRALHRYREAERREGGESPRRRGRRQTNNPERVKQDAINASAMVEHAVSCPRPDEGITVYKLAAEPDFRLRKIKEALFIRNNQCLNRDQGEEVNDIWATVATRTNFCRLNLQTD
uniref:Reverse transcriptase domain-containing protein n=1 Tax=Trichuris muris TaxID=70415 RepID=A0A5S6QSR1_TRIMR